MGVTISNHELICISVVVGGNTSKCSLGMTPFGSLSPKHYGPKRVPGVYQCLLSSSLSPQQVYTLWACSLLVIPPPIGRTVPQGGFLTDLSELNLLGWAALVQDMVAGLQALPPRLSHDLGLQVVALLQLLEVATGVGFCHHCCNLRPHCKCMGASQLAPPIAWSQVVEQTPGYGVTSSSGGVTTPEYLHRRYAWICGTSSRPHPSRFLHLECASSGGLSTQGTTCIPTIPTSRWEGCTHESHSG